MRAMMIKYMEASAQRIKSCFWWKYYAIILTILLFIDKC